VEDNGADIDVGPVGKNSKGLRHFSIKVCQKVEEKQITSYNEVADELVAEFESLVSTEGKVGGVLLNNRPVPLCVTKEPLTHPHPCCCCARSNTTRRTSGGACTTR
jgi:hypothetical protein